MAAGFGGLVVEGKDVAEPLESAHGLVFLVAVEVEIDVKVLGEAFVGLFKGGEVGDLDVFRLAGAQEGAGAGDGAVFSVEEAGVAIGGDVVVEIPEVEPFEIGPGAEAIPEAAEFEPDRGAPYERDAPPAAT